jgi:hypothetical protein
MTTFKDLNFESRGAMGIQARHEFANGYGASVIKGPYTYGGRDGLFELAVCHGGELVYDTPIGDDVVGRLTPDEVTTLLAQIEALPARETR